jgi:predicted 3-demethylubiquinone-9 3-methyltransferase (glyoxalase superfamily)
MQKITPFLWYNDNAEEAVDFYRGIFKDTKVTGMTHYGEAGPGLKGSVMTIAFELFGQEFTAINGGPHFQFTPAVSFVVNCETQEEVDKYWDALSAGGRLDQCGWLQDKYGLSWQITPVVLIEMLQDEDAEKRERVMAAMMKMVKLDIAALKQAYDGE